MKKIMALLLTTFMIVSIFAGCGGKDTTDTTSTEPSTEAGAESTDTALEPTSSGDKVTIELYLQKTNAVEQFNELIKMFEAENPNIKVELTSVPDPETALVSRIAASDYPDIMTIWPAEVFYRDLMKDGALVDLSDQEFLNQVSKDARDIAQYEGKDYSLSMTMSAYGIIINKDIFQEQGLEAPKTWDELITVSKALQDAGVQPFSFYGKSTEQVGQLGERLIGVIDNDITSTMQKVSSGEIAPDDFTQARDAGNALVELHQYGQKDILGYDYETAFNEVATGKAAMLIYGSWGVSTLQNINPDINLEMVPLPNPTGGESNIAVSIDTALCVTESSDHKEEAIKFLEFMSRTDTAQWYADNEKNPPVISGVNYNVEPLKTMQEEILAGKIFFTPSVYWPAGMRTSWESPIQGLIDPTGSNDVEAFVVATADICKEYLA